MKKISLIAALAVSTMLSACGGGGGGGHSFVPPATIPDTPGTDIKKDADNSDLTMMKTRVVKDKDGSFTDLVNDTLVVAYQEHETRSGIMKLRTFASRAEDDGYMNNTNICKSKDDCNQEIFENMKKILIDRDFANASATELRNALILAGFKDDLAGIWDDVNELQNYILEHPDEIENRTSEIYNNYTVTLENVKLTFVRDEAVQDAFVTFALDDNKRIKGIYIEEDTTSPQKYMKYSLERQGEENNFKETKEFYVYGLRIGTDCTKGACSPDSGTSLHVLSKDELSPDEIRKRLLSLFEEEFNEGGFSGLHGGTNNGQFQEGDDVRFRDYAEDFIKNLSDEDLKNTNMDDITFDHAYSGKITYTIVSDYQSAAKDMKLAYSDFGLMTVVNTEKYDIRDEAEEKTSTMIFAGGYDDKRMTKENLQKVGGKMTFKGKAIGGVNFSENDNWLVEKDVVSDTLLLTSDKQDNATLTFNNGTQKLTAEFNNWYDVEVTKDFGDQATIKFTGGEKIQGTDKVSADDFKFRGQNQYIVKDFVGEQMIKAYGDEHIVIEQGGDVSGTSVGAVDIGYYGNNGSPSEATGYIMYGESAPVEGENRVRGLDVSIGFGTQRQ